MNSHVVTAPRLLWFDLTHDQSATDCTPAFANACDIHLVRDLRTSGLNSQHPDMICMHYDRPDALGLRLLREVKKAAPSVPITMLTVQHSEDLAVWAFRSKVWDYLVLPLVVSERERYLQALRELCQLRNSAQGTALKVPLSQHNPLPESVRLTNQYQKQQPLQGAVQYIDEHFHQHIEQSQLARHCGMTPFRFSRLFKQTYEVGFVEFVLAKRMEKADELLRHSQMPITSIAYAVGFQDPSYFARAFKQYFGCCPSDFRRVGALTADCLSIATSKQSSPFNPLVQPHDG